MPDTYKLNPFTKKLDNVGITTTANYGSATLVAGTVTVANSVVTANSDIFLTGQNSGGTAGELSVTARTPGVSFVITSSNVADTRTVAWLLYEPAAAGASSTGQAYGLLLALTQP